MLSKKPEQQDKGGAKPNSVLTVGGALGEAAGAGAGAIAGGVKAGMEVAEAGAKAVQHKREDMGL